MTEETKPIYVCGRCFAWGDNGEPPHGWQEPCPVVDREEKRAEELNDASIAAADAARMAHLRQAQATEATFSEMRKAFGGDDEEA